MKIYSSGKDTSPLGMSCKHENAPACEQWGAPICFRQEWSWAWAEMYLLICPGLPTQSLPTHRQQLNLTGGIYFLFTGKEELLINSNLTLKVWSLYAYGYVWVRIGTELHWHCGHFGTNELHINIAPCVASLNQNFIIPIDSVLLCSLYGCVAFWFC